MNMLNILSQTRLMAKLEQLRLQQKSSIPFFGQSLFSTKTNQATTKQPKPTSLKGITNIQCHPTKSYRSFLSRLPAYNERSSTPQK